MNLFNRLGAKIARLQKQIDAEKSPKGLSYVEFEKMTDKPPYMKWLLRYNKLYLLIDKLSAKKK